MLIPPLNTASAPGPNRPIDAAPYMKKSSIRSFLLYPGGGENASTGATRSSIKTVSSKIL
jgi:hypothetical protein